MASIEELLRDLSTREQIRDRIYRYCRGVDRVDMAEMASAFWDDGF